MGFWFSIFAHVHHEVLQSFFTKTNNNKLRYSETAEHSDARQHNVGNSLMFLWL